MAVSDNSILAEKIADFFENVGRNRFNGAKKMAKDALKNPGRALENGANAGTAFASTSPKVALSSIPEVIKFYHTGKGPYLGKLVWFYAI